MVQSLSLALLASLSTVASAIPTIEVKGSKLFTSEGNQFYVKGTYAILQQNEVKEALISNDSV